MAERRQAHRREPIEVEVRDRVMEAHPLPWLIRNELGNEILRQYSEVMNSLLKAYVEKPEGSEQAVPQVEMYVNDKISDPILIIQKAYPDTDREFLNTLSYSELLDLVYAAIEVNELESLKDLVDPNSSTPMENGGITSSGEETQESTPNPPSTPDSPSPASIVEQSSL